MRAFAQPVSVVRTFNFNVPQQSLATALVRFSEITGVGVIADHGVIPKVSSSGASGNLTAEQALEKFFPVAACVSVHQRQDGDAAQQALDARAQAVDLDTINVEGRSGFRQEGEAKDGYRVKTVSSVGALGAMPLQDAVHHQVAPRELIQKCPGAVARRRLEDPADHTHQHAAGRPGRRWSSSAASVSISRMTGCARSTSHGTVLEDKERIEVFSGPTGFTVWRHRAGRHDQLRLQAADQGWTNSVTVGNYGGEQAFVHGDFGGPIDPAGRPATG